ncbi:MAG: hypothetical protein KAJ75_05660 [Alphaproteobacteria bacterium]|nr:hypothetical protein [Alphaproteobacteria bacterium]
MARFGKKTHQLVRDAFEELTARNGGGGVTSHQFLKFSTPKDSYTHRLFDWDNKSASDKYRLQQARQLLSSITIEVSGVRTRELENLIIEVEDNRERKYLHIEKILSDEDLKEQVVASVVRQLRMTIDRYRKYKEIYKLINTKELKKLEKKYQVSSFV